MNAYTHYYVFETKSIQDFIFQGGQLKLAVGGSELVEQLPKKLLPELLRQLDLTEKEDFEFLSQNAGSARLLFKDQKGVDKLIHILPLVINCYAPGLDFVQTAVPLDNGLTEAMAAAGKTLRERRNLAFPDLPEVATPFTPHNRADRSSCKLCPKQ